MIEAYTRVLQGHVRTSRRGSLQCLTLPQIAIDSATFPEGTTGKQLDVLARKALWKDGLNYMVRLSLLLFRVFCRTYRCVYYFSTAPGTGLAPSSMFMKALMVSRATLLLYRGMSSPTSLASVGKLRLLYAPFTDYFPQQTRLIIGACVSSRRCSSSALRYVTLASRSGVALSMRHRPSTSSTATFGSASSV